MITERTLQRGDSVSWDGFKQKRYGCVMAINGEIAEIQASNARVHVPVDILTYEPSIGDPITADINSTYGKMQ